MSDDDGDDYNDEDEDDAGGDDDLKHVFDSFERSSIPWQPFQWQESVVNIS